MEFQKCIDSRRSIRHFNSKPIEDNVIVQLITAAINAPSWKNSQVTRYYAIVDEEKRKAILDAMPEFNKRATQSAAVILVSSVVKNRSGYNREGEFETPKGNGWQMYDCGASNVIVTLKANELGLGSVIMGIYDEEKVTKALEIPETEEIVSIIALGYYDKQVEMPKRKSVESILKVL